jgi:hypothetical protein
MAGAIRHFKVRLLTLTSGHLLLSRPLVPRLWSITASIYDNAAHQPPCRVRDSSYKYTYKKQGDRDIGSEREKKMLRLAIQ